MKKLFIISLLFVMALSLSACGKKEQAQAPAPKGLQVTENNTLMGWLKKGKTVECTIETEIGKIKMYAQNEKVRMEGMPYYSMDSTGEAPKAENGVSLTVGDMMYIWDKAKKKGMKMNLKEMENLGKELGEEQEQKTWEETVEDWEDAKVAYDCKETRISNDIFKAPDGVEFMDLTEMAKGMAEMGKKLDEQMNNSEVDLEALEEMTKNLKIPGVE